MHALIKINSKLSIGDYLPTIENLTGINSKNNNLHHISGTVMLI